MVYNTYKEYKSKKIVMKPVEPCRIKIRQVRLKGANINQKEGMSYEI